MPKTRQMVTLFIFLSYVHFHYCTTIMRWTSLLSHHFAMSTWCSNGRSSTTADMTTGSDSLRPGMQRDSGMLLRPRTPTKSTQRLAVALTDAESAPHSSWRDLTRTVAHSETLLHRANAHCLGLQSRYTAFAVPRPDGRLHPIPSLVLPVFFRFRIHVGWYTIFDFEAISLLLHNLGA